MDVIFERCAGLDVHKKTVVACRVRPKASGGVEMEIRTFGTLTRDLLALLDWLQAWECTHVAMESTGVYWQPVHNILEGTIEVWLVNAHHVKTVPGRKTDVKDAEWLADLLRHGVVRPSFIPPRPQRDLRELTRQRASLVRERSSVANRLQKVLESANLKLASVASDIQGVSARAILTKIAEGHDDPQALADLAHGRLRKKQAELEAALVGRVREHHRFLIARTLAHLDFLDEEIEAFDTEIARRIETPTPPPQPPSDASELQTHQTDTTPAETDTPTPPAPDAPLSWAEAVALLDTMPGVNRRLAEVIVAEIGVDMARFPSAKHLASWAGLSPGNNQSAGKQRSGKIAPGDRPLRKALLQGAQVVGRAREGYLAAQFRRLAAKRGKRRAVVAVAHSMLVIVYHILHRREAYRDLGVNYFDERERDKVIHRLQRRLEKLGCRVSIERQAVAA